MEWKLIGNKIRAQRQSLGLKQQELADKVGVTWEMISRYERGKSSPLEKIELIAKALNTNPLELLQEYYNSSGVAEKAETNTIPLFTSEPDNLDFNLKPGQYYYVAPTWMFKADPKVFAIDPNIANIKTVQIKVKGPLFISPTTRSNEHDLVLYIENHKLFIDIKSNISNKTSEIIGTIIAQELRFI